MKQLIYILTATLLLSACSAEKRAQRQVRKAERHLAKAEKLFPASVREYNDTTRVVDSIHIVDTVTVTRRAFDTIFEMQPDTDVSFEVDSADVSLSRRGTDSFAFKFDPRPFNFVIDTLFKIDTVYLTKKKKIKQPEPEDKGFPWRTVMIIAGIVFGILFLLLIVRLIIDRIFK